MVEGERGGDPPARSTSSPHARHSSNTSPLRVAVSCVENVVADTRNSPGPEHVELLGFLHRTWQMVEKYELSIRTDGTSKASMKNCFRL